MYTFRGCESHDFCICHSTFVTFEHSLRMKKEKLKKKIFERRKKKEGIEKEKIQIQISHLGKEAGVGRNKTWKQY